MVRIDRQRIQLTLAVGLPSLAAATIIVGLLQESVGVPNASALYLVAVVLTAIVAGTIGAVVASVASFLIYNFLFTAFLDA